MAFATTKYTGNGYTGLYSIPFPYLSPTDLFVTVNGTAVPFTLTTGGQAYLATAPASGAAVVVGRKTSVTAPVTSFTDGAILVSADLNRASLQTLYVSQETRDYADEQKAYVDSLPLLPPVSGSVNYFAITDGTNWLKRSPSDAAALLNLSVSDSSYVVAAFRSTQNGGSYPAANATVQVALNTVLNAGGLTVYISGGAVSLPSGRYRFRHRQQVAGIGTALVQVIVEGISTLYGSPQLTTVGTTSILEATGEFVISARTRVLVYVRGTAANTGAATLGVVSPLGHPEGTIYSQIELWRVGIS